MRTDRRGEEGVVIRERRGSSRQFGAATETLVKKKKEKDVVQRGFLSESGVGLHRAARLRSGASRVKDESPPPNRTDADVIDRGIAGLRHDVAFADRLLCVRSGS